MLCLYQAALFCIYLLFNAPIKWITVLSGSLTSIPAQRYNSICSACTLPSIPSPASCTALKTIVVARSNHWFIIVTVTSVKSKNNTLLGSSLLRYSTYVELRRFHFSRVVCATVSFTLEIDASCCCCGYGLCSVFLQYIR